MILYYQQDLQGFIAMDWPSKFVDGVKVSDHLQRLHHIPSRRLDNLRPRVHLQEEVAIPERDGIDRIAVGKYTSMFVYLSDTVWYKIGDL